MRGSAGASRPVSARRSPWLLACAALLVALPCGTAAAEAPAQAVSPLNAAIGESDAVHWQATALVEKERFAEAIPLLERDVALAEKVVALLAKKGRLPKQHRQSAPSPEELVARALDQLGYALIELGRHARAEQVLSRSRAIYDRILVPGENDDFKALALAGLLRLAAIRGDHAFADAVLREVDGPIEPRNGVYAPYCYVELGRLFALRGEHARAEDLMKKGLLGGELARTDVLRSLADLYLDLRRPEDAEPLLRRAVETASFEAKKSGVPSPRLALILSSLGRLYLQLDDLARAEQAFTRALSIQEEALGPEHLAVAASLDGLALGYTKSTEPARAAPLLARALSIRENVLGPGHAETAEIRLHLGDLRRASGDPGAAAELYRRALADLEKALGGEHPAVGEALLRLAALARAGSPPDPALAEALGRRALAIFEKAFGAEHFRVADALDPLAETWVRSGRIQDAVRALARSVEIRDRRAAGLLAAGSEAQKLAAVAALREQTDLVLSLPSRSSPPDAAAVELALTTVLRRKGRVLDALATSRAAVRDRRRPEDERLLRELVAIQGRIVDALVNGPGAVPVAEHDAAIEELTRQKERLEAELGKRSATIVRDDRLVTLAEVGAAIPEDAALVEMVVHRPAGEGSRLAAYVLRRRGAPRFVDLGEARAIDALVAELRPALSRPQRDPAPIARALDERTMRPVRALLGDARRILISPDGELNLIPLGALVDEEGRSLIDRLSISYLSSGRDLVRFLHDETPPEPGPAAVLIGAPDFGDPDRKRSRYRPGAHEGAVELGDIRFRPLAGTATEVETIRALVPGAKVLTGAEATEEAVKAVVHPRILHLATHGFFLPPEIASAGRSLDNPLLRAGVALATANQPVPGREDGILTALEVAGLDLYGTRLVVLSACDSGVGEARSGEGVHGLRRAVAMAGGQTLVMSLWHVSDQDTRDLMVAYHRLLQQGGGRSEALREAALAVRAVPGNAHPFYWAAFISSGDWSTLEGKDVPSRVVVPPPVAPGPRGCGCMSGPGPEGGGAALSITALLIGCLRRSRRRGDGHSNIEGRKERQSCQAS